MVIPLNSSPNLQFYFTVSVHNHLTSRSSFQQPTCIPYFLIFFHPQVLYSILRGEEGDNEEDATVVPNPVKHPSSKVINYFILPTVPISNSCSLYVQHIARQHRVKETAECEFCLVKADVSKVCLLKVFKQFDRNGILISEFVFNGIHAYSSPPNLTDSICSTSVQPALALPLHSALCIHTTNLF